MITRVLNSRGEVLHDCEALGCSVSWDGEPIPGRSQAAPEQAPALPADHAQVAATLDTAGEPTAIPEQYEKVDDKTVRIKPPPEF